MSLPRPLLALAVAGIMLCAPSAQAVDAARQMTFQGRLVRADGSPETAPQDLRFALYATAAGGAPLWEESHLSTPVTNGYYAVVLGASVPLPANVLNGQPLYLGVSLVGQSELTPRVPVVSVPYALLSNDSNRLEGRAASSFASATHTHLPATTAANGFMATTDKTKLNGLPSTYGPGLGFNSTSSTLSVAFGTSGTAATAARSDHTHPLPSLSCTYRTASGNIDANKNSTAWCAAGELLMGGGCANLNGTTTVPGISFTPVGVSTQDGSTSIGGPGYTCRLPTPAADASVPVAHAICCRIQ